jgi:putative colanic acid biosysnthesis UDP-glucose lipid carrier transferase
MGRNGVTMMQGGNMADRYGPDRPLLARAVGPANDASRADGHIAAMTGGEAGLASGAVGLVQPRVHDEESADIRALADGSERLSRSRLKRLIDIVGAIAGIILLSPLLLLAALAIIVESPGAPLFRQRRSGLNGSTFVIYKFRTMRVVEDGAHVMQAQRDDERVTRVGLFLRRTSVDELPQLINILKGEMSLVGPRPHAVIHDEYYGACIREYKDRFRAKPGLTGLAQVEGLRGPTPTVATMAARIDRDLTYIRNWSIFMDLQIIIKTMLIVAFHSSAY